MCGIGALLQPAGSEAGFAMGDEHLNLLARRGPDVQRTMRLPLQTDNAGVDARLVLHGSVLSMRGTSPLPQPLVSGRYNRANPLRFSDLEAHLYTACICFGTEKCTAALT